MTGKIAGFFKPGDKVPKSETVVVPFVNRREQASPEVASKMLVPVIVQPIVNEEVDPEEEVMTDMELAGALDEAEAKEAGGKRMVSDEEWAAICQKWKSRQLLSAEEINTLVKTAEENDGDAEAVQIAIDALDAAKAAKDVVKRYEVVDSKKMLPVFVYGTLKKGFGNHFRVEPHIEQLVPAKLMSNKFVLYDGKSFPAVLESAYNESSYISGQLIYIKEGEYKEAMADLDQLEGVSTGFYRRIHAAAIVEGDEERRAIPCWLYIAGENLARDARTSWTRVFGGSWRA